MDIFNDLAKESWLKLEDITIDPKRKPRIVFQTSWLSVSGTVKLRGFPPDLLHNWLVVEPTHMKNMSQNGNLPQKEAKIKNV